jgi:GT2 family glycosyltransferase
MASKGGASGKYISARYKLNDPAQNLWPKVTVVIVNWNGEHFLERCLSALMRQTVAPHEIILLDNASSDSSLCVVRRFPSVRLLSQNKNYGFARGNNLAIKMAASDSEWIALLNPDAFAEPRWLEALLVAVRDYPAFDIVGSKLVNAIDPTVLDGAGDAYHISGLVWRIGHGARVLPVSEEVQEIFSPCAAAAMYRRSALLEVVGFDEDYFCYVEDVDLGFRLRLAGYRCLYVPMSIVHHMGSATTGGKHSDFAVYHGHRNLVWTYVKNMPGALFWFLLPLQLLLNLITIGVFTIRGQRKVILKAKRDAIKGLTLSWIKRKNIQNQRIVGIRTIWQVLDKHLLPDKKKQGGCHSEKKI